MFINHQLGAGRVLSFPGTPTMELNSSGCILLYVHTMGALFSLALHIKTEADKSAANGIKRRVKTATLNIMLYMSRNTKTFESISHFMHSGQSIKWV